MLSTTLVAVSLATASLAVAACGESTTTTKSTVASSTTETTAAEAAAAATLTTPAPSVNVKLASGARLTQAQWLAKSEAICARTNAELETLSVKKATELARVLPQAAAYVRREVTQLAKVVPPASKTQDWQAFLDANLQWAENTAKMAEYSKAGGTITRSPAATAAIAAHQRGLIIARRDHFRACSHS